MHTVKQRLKEKRKLPAKNKKKLQEQHPLQILIKINIKNGLKVLKKWLKGKVLKVIKEKLIEL